MKAGAREWVGLVVLALPTLLVTMDLSVLFLAVPKLTRDLHPSSSQLLWISDVYGLMIAASLIAMGTIGDRIGRRRLLLIGGGAFALASMLAAFSTNPGMLIAARALLGVAGASLAPSALALIRNMFEDSDQLKLAISIWISCFAAGAAMGPLIGGVLLQHFWWGAVFLTSIPVMALLLGLGPRILPESADPNPGRIDLVSVVLSLTSLVAIVYGVTRMAEVGPRAMTIALVVAGLMIGAMFVHRQGHVDYPLVDIRLFRLRRFSAAFAAMFVSVFIIAGTDLYIAQYIQLVHGVSPFVTGLWLLPGIFGLIVGSMVAPVLGRVLRPGVVIAAGLLLATIGAIVLAGLSDTSNLLLLIAGATLLGIGIGPVGALGTDILVGAAPLERAGAASAVSETATELGGALGIALLGSLGTAIYRSTLTDRIPSGISPSSAAASKNTLGGALDTASRLGAHFGDPLRSVARAAFTHGFVVAAAAGAAITVITAAIAAFTLRNTEAELSGEAAE